MTHFAVFAPPLRGHYRPLSNLAAELLARGHRVTFVHQEDARELVEAEGAEFAAVGQDMASLTSWTGPMARIRGLIGLGNTMRRMETFTTLLCEEAPLLLRECKIDAVIADQLEPAGGLVAEHLGLPWISTATTLPMNREAGVPPPFVPWGYEEGEKGRRRNRGGWRVTDLILQGFNRTIARNAGALGLPPRRRMEDCFSPLLQLSQIVPGLDFPRTELPEQFHYAGPFRRPWEEAFQLPPSDGRPTAYCTLGTLQGSRVKVFRRIAEACRRAGVRLVITVGHAPELKAHHLPGDPLVYDWVPQEAVVRQVNLVVSHAGMNSVLDPVSAGIPMVLMPLAFEQPGIAARVAHSGAGLALSRRASAPTLAQAIRTVLDDPGYRRRAVELRKEVEPAGGTTRAVDLIEQALGAGALTAAATRAHRARDDARGDSRSGNS